MPAAINQIHSTQATFFTDMEQGAVCSGYILFAIWTSYQSTLVDKRANNNYHEWPKQRVKGEVGAVKPVLALQ